VKKKVKGKNIHVTLDKNANVVKVKYAHGATVLW